MLSPNSAEIIARLSAAERAIVAQRMANIERALNRRSKIATWLLWILQDARGRPALGKTDNPRAEEARRRD